MQYKITDLDELFVKRAIDEIEGKFYNLLDLCTLINTHIEHHKTPIKKYDPVQEKEVEFDFPMAYHIWIMYYYATSKKEDLSIEASLSAYRKIFINNPMFSKLNYRIDRTKLYNTHTGFLYYLCELKTKIYDGYSLTAKELATALGLTTQAITNRIRRETADFKYKKSGGVYQIPN
ncbi:MAG: hypothetical protein ACOCRK_10635, partial [bacterium]